MNMFFAQLNKPEITQSTIVFLTERICTEENVDDPEGCALGVETWWPRISHTIWSEGAAPYVCQGLNNECEVFSTRSVKEWGCEACQADVASVAQLYMSSEAQAKIVEFLQGETFCGGLGLEEAEVAFCQEAIGGFMPPALTILFESLVGDEDSICTYIYQLPCGGKKPWFVN